MLLDGGRRLGWVSRAKGNEVLEKIRKIGKVSRQGVRDGVNVRNS